MFKYYCASYFRSRKISAERHGIGERNVCGGSLGAGVGVQGGLRDDGRHVVDVTATRGVVGGSSSHTNNIWNLFHASVALPRTPGNARAWGNPGNVQKGVHRRKHITTLVGQGLVPSPPLASLWCKLRPQISYFFLGYFFKRFWPFLISLTPNEPLLLGAVIYREGGVRALSLRIKACCRDGVDWPIAPPRPVPFGPSPQSILSDLAGVRPHSPQRGGGDASWLWWRWAKGSVRKPWNTGKQIIQTRVKQLAGMGHSNNRYLWFKYSM